MTRRFLRRSIAAMVAVLALVLAGAGPATAQSAIEDDFTELGTHWYAATGVWEASGGVAAAISGGGEHGPRLALLGYRLQESSSVEVTLRTVDGGPSAWAGVTVHRDGLADSYTGSGYTVLLRNNGELAIIAADGAGGVRYLAAAQTPARPGEDWQTLKVDLGPGELAASVAGVTIEALDDAFDHGGVTIASHRDARVQLDRVSVNGVVEVEESIPRPGDCLTWSGEPEVGERGEVLNSAERIVAVRQRVEAGVEPQASGAELLMAEVAQDLLRRPDAPETYFVPFFYNDPDAHRAARDGLQNDANAAYRLALAYRLTGQEHYAEHAASFLDEWSATVACVRTSEDSALAFSYHFPAFVFAAELLRDSAAWPAAEEERFAGFLRQVALPAAESIIHRNNNWGSWALALKAGVAAYLDDAGLLDEAHARARALADHQMNSDAHLHEEVTRNDGVGDYGIWYSHFSLFPNLLAAEILSGHGSDLHSYVNVHGVTTGEAGAEVAGWVEDPESFPYFSGDVADLANVRTIDYLRADGVLAHSMSYFELLGNHYDIGAVDRLLAEEGAMTTIHAAPHLSLTHGGLPPDALDGSPGGPGGPDGPDGPGGSDGSGDDGDDAPARPDPGPAGPRAEDLTEATRGLIRVLGGNELVRGGDVTIEVDVVHAGKQLAVYLFSEPVELDVRPASDQGRATYPVPEDIPLGEHRLAVYGADGDLIGWEAVTVVAAASPPGGSGPPSSATGLPATGTRSAGLLVVSLGLLVVGALAWRARRSLA